MAGFGSASGFSSPNSVEQGFARKRMEAMQANEDKQSKKPTPPREEKTKAY
jgi:hypothetical protein